MTRLYVAAAAAIGLILLVAFVASRLVRSRATGVSIRMQVFLALGSVVGAFAFGVGVLVLDRIEARATLLAEAAAGDQATAIASLLGTEMEAREQALTELASRLGRPRADAPEMHLAILDPDGNELLSRGPRAGAPGHVFVVAPIVVHDRTVGSVRVGKPTLVVQQALTDFAPTILVISMVLGVAAALAAAIIGRAIATPIEALTEFAVRVSEGERLAVPPPAEGREVQRLTRAIDSMRRQLEGRPFVETFAADLSHELKNPVAAIRASAEVLADGALDEPEEAKRFVDRIQEATGRIETLLANLLSLARIEARGVEQAEIVNVADVVRGVAGPEDPAVNVAAPANASVRGDRLWLSRAVENLIDNAKRHGAPGRPVTVEVVKDASNVTVVVKNAGKIDRYVATRLFRRFVTTREDRGGTGLGLAIVRAIAEAHAGSAEVTSEGPPEVTFRIRLPSA